MPLQFKTDVLKLLKENGYSTYRLRKEKIFGEASIQKIRHNQIPSLEILNQICAMTNMQPGQLVEHIPDKD